MWSNVIKEVVTQRKEFDITELRSFIDWSDFKKVDDYTNVVFLQCLRRFNSVFQGFVAFACKFSVMEAPPPPKRGGSAVKNLFCVNVSHSSNTTQQLCYTLLIWFSVGFVSSHSVTPSLILTLKYRMNRVWPGLTTLARWGGGGCPMASFFNTLWTFRDP